MTIDMLSAAHRRAYQIELEIDAARERNDWQEVARLAAEHWRAIRHTIAHRAPRKAA